MSYREKIFIMLQEDCWLLPEGIEEVLPAEAKRLERLRRKVLDLFETWGYRQVTPPFIEFIETLLVGTGKDLDLKTFKLIDQMSGRLMGVRADMTPQVARIDARHSVADQPARLCYLGTVLHTQSDHLEKTRSPLQIGAELYGHAGNASDLEIIKLMLEMLSASGLNQVYLDLGHVGIYRCLVKQADLNASQEAVLFEILQRKARPELLEFLSSNGIDETHAALLGALIDLNGGLEVIEQAQQRLGSFEVVQKALEDLRRIALSLSKAFPDLSIHFDLAELRGYHYQTGVVFAAFVPGYGREVARGGRYDEVGRIYGSQRPATGFSADLNVLARLGGLKVESPDMIFAPLSDDPLLDIEIRALRSQGRIVVQELEGQRADAKQMGCRSYLSQQDKAWVVLPINQ